MNGVCSNGFLINFYSVYNDQLYKALLPLQKASTAQIPGRQKGKDL